MTQWVSRRRIPTGDEGLPRIRQRPAGRPASTPVVDIPKISSLWIGGWYGNYNFVGDVDEVRISKVVRSPDWVRLEYENQKPLQTLTGPVVQAGSSLAVSPEQSWLTKARVAPFRPQAGGAESLLDSQARRPGNRGRRGPVLLHVRCRPRGGRYSVRLQFKAVYPQEVKTRDIPITIKEAIPEPVFTLQSPGELGRPGDD